MKIVQYSKNTINCRFLQIDYYLRPYITGRGRVDKVHRPGAQILKVYKQLTEQDALTLTKMPDTQQALMRWNASLRNIATIVRNHTSGDLRRACVLSLCIYTGRITCLARPFICPFVCHVRASVS